MLLCNRRFRYRVLRILVPVLLIFVFLSFFSIGSIHKRKIASSQIDETIVIGIVCCGGGHGKSKVLTALAKPVRLIKSVLLSAKISGTTSIEFHIITDSWMLERLFTEKLEEFNKVARDFVQINVNFYKLLQMIPPNTEQFFVNGHTKCGHVRLFFPRTLPPHLKYILYLDTDILITGNIVQIWRNFKQKLEAGQPKLLAAMVQNTEVHDNRTYLDMYAALFPDMPHVLPRGVNSGVIFMNLDAMRRFNWTVEVFKVWQRKPGARDQQLINMLFAENLDRLTQFSCQYNFMFPHCEKGFACTSLREDPNGIHIVHGAGMMWATHPAFESLFDAYEKFQLDRHEDVETELFLELRNRYRTIYANTNETDKECYGAFAKYLFKQFAWKEHEA